MTNTVDRLTQKLRGQTLQVPNLFGFYSQWPMEISPHYDQLTETIDSKIAEWISDEPVSRKAHKINLPVFCSVWYPRSSLDRLETIAWYSMWLFLWDDVIEDSAIPTAEGVNKIQWLHREALKYVKFHLGLSDACVEPGPPTKYCSLFKHAGAPLREACTVEERQRFYDTVEEYMGCVEVESEFVGKGELPTLDEYWKHRLGTTSIHTYCALGEYMGGRHIPAELFQTPELKTLCYEFNRQIIIFNDIASLKKELGQSIHSLVPVMINETGADLDTAIASIIGILRVSGDNMNSAAEKLLGMAQDPKIKADVETYLLNFFTCTTGNYWWSLICERYSVTKYLGEDGTLVIPL